jgi:hypothetical protein
VPKRLLQGYARHVEPALHQHQLRYLAISNGIFRARSRAHACQSGAQSAKVVGFKAMTEERAKMASVFAVPVFDATVIVEGSELFKGRGAAEGWASKLAAELEIDIAVEKIGTGWALCGKLDGVDTKWGILGQRLKRMD